MDKIHWSSEYLHEYPVSNQQEYIKMEHQADMLYPATFYTASPSASPNSSMIFGTESFGTSPSSFQLSGPGSPDSFMSAPIYQPPQLVQSCSSSTTSSSATAYLNETIAKASALPEAFYPEFLQYSKETFESNSKKRSRSEQSSDEDEDDDEKSVSACKQQKVEQKKQEGKTSVSELRRQIHIQSEQKRRAQIKDGFEDLRAELPACLNKKMSKVTLLHRTVQHIQHLKSTQMTILAELERLAQENEQLRNFQQSVLQKQALENMYSIGNM